MQMELVHVVNDRCKSRNEKTCFKPLNDWLIYPIDPRKCNMDAHPPNRIEYVPPRTGERIQTLTIHTAQGTPCFTFQMLPTHSSADQEARHIHSWNPGTAAVSKTCF